MQMYIPIVFSSLLLFSGSAVSDSFAAPWTVACQAPLSLGFPRQEYCSGLPFLPPQRSEAICILFGISDTYMCRCVPILHIQIYHPVAEIETRCPGRGHTDGSWQSWDSKAAQTPEWTRAGDIMSLVIGSSCFSLKPLTAAHGPAGGHRRGSLDTV